MDFEKLLEKEYSQLNLLSENDIKNKLISLFGFFSYSAFLYLSTLPAFLPVSLPVISVVGGLYLGHKLFRRGEQRELWTRLTKLIEDRDEIFATIDRKELSKEEARRKYGKTVARISREIQDIGDHLERIISNDIGSSGSMRNDISDEDINKMRDFLKKAATVSEYFASHK